MRNNRIRLLPRTHFCVIPGDPSFPKAEFASFYVCANIATPGKIKLFHEMSTKMRSKVKFRSSLQLLIPRAKQMVVSD